MIPHAYYQAHTSAYLIKQAASLIAVAGPATAPASQKPVTDVINMFEWAAAHNKPVPSEETLGHMRLINAHSVNLGLAPGQQAYVIGDIIMVRNYYAA